MNTEVKKNLALIEDFFDILSQEHKVKKIGIFGSVAKNSYTKDSDIDILVEFSQPVSLFAFIELENFLSKSLKRKVDLVTKNALKPAIKKDVLKEVLYV